MFFIEKFNIRSKRDQFSVIDDSFKEQNSTLIRQKLTLTYVGCELGMGTLQHYKLTPCQPMYKNQIIHIHDM